MRQLIVLLACTAAALPAQNSMRKIRPQPSATAAKAGSAVQWRASVQAALEESRTSGKPVFWYVPTVSGSPMDRKPEIDRYMMAGPFSWPALIALLNGGFVPVRAPAGGGLASKYDLVRGRFIEPGFLVLDAAGAATAKVDRLTTLHEGWMLRRLRGLTKTEAARPQPTAAEKAFRAGVELFYAGQSDKALEHWRAVAAKFPDDPVAWKAAAEAEGHGPLRYGFEVASDLPEAVLEGAATSSQAPPGVYDERAARQRSLAFLCRMQLGNGGWEDSRYDFGGTDSLPNVYTACTAIIATALLEELSLAPVLGEKERMEKALTRAIAYLRDEAHLNLQDRDELIWAHVYRVYFYSRYLELRGGKEGAAVTREDLQGVVGQVFAMQPGTGAWYHEYANPFVTAEALVALHRAEQAGAVLDKAKVARGVAALRRCRAQSGAFSYGYGRRPSSQKEGAAGRMPLCELALLLRGDAAQEDLEAALAAGFEHHGLLAAVRKYDDHADRHGYGGFFFWFDMLGRTRALLAVKDQATRERHAAAQRALVLALPEIDGCFVDSHELGRCYGTAMALLCLAELRRGR